MWAFSLNLTTWSAIPKSDIWPSPRSAFGFDMFSNRSAFVIYGGKDDTTFWNEIYVYYIDANLWVQFSSEGDSPGTAVSDITCRLISDLEMVCGGGVDISDAGSSNFYLYSFVTKLWRIWSSLPTAILPRSRIGLANIGNNTLILNAGNYYDEISNELYVIKPGVSQKLDASASLVSPLARRSSITLFYGDRVIMLSGIGAMQNLNLRSNRAFMTDTWEFKLGPVCSPETTLLPSSQLVYGACINCSVGTYETRGKCVTCPAGVFSHIFHIVRIVQSIPWCQRMHQMQCWLFWFY